MVPKLLLTPSLSFETYQLVLAKMKPNAFLELLQVLLPKGGVDETPRVDFSLHHVALQQCPGAIYSPDTSTCPEATNRTNNSYFQFHAEMHCPAAQPSHYFGLFEPDHLSAGLHQKNPKIMSCNCRSITGGLEKTHAKWCRMWPCGQAVLKESSHEH